MRSGSENHPEVKVNNAQQKTSVMTRIANQHQQQGLKRFLFCLIFWFLATQCDYEWVFNSVQTYLQPETELEVNEQGSESDSEPYKSTGKN